MINCSPQIADPVQLILWIHENILSHPVTLKTVSKIVQILMRHPVCWCWPNSWQLCIFIWRFIIHITQNRNVAFELVEYVFLYEQCFMITLCPEETYIIYKTAVFFLEWRNNNLKVENLFYENGHTSLALFTNVWTPSCTPIV